jgi:hypothetical protein
MKKFTKMFVGVFCALLLAAPVFAASTPVAVTTTTATPTNSWVLTLGGSGATTTTADSETAFGLSFGLGKQFSETLPLVGTVSLESGVRQTVGYATQKNASSTTLFSTRPYVDTTLYTVGPVSVYAGGNSGATYGNMPLRWTAAPEWGVDVKLAKNVLLDGRMDYAFDLNPSQKAQNALEYFVGIKFLF